MKDRMPRVDVDFVLRGLKDFQRDTVDYVFSRLYEDADAQRRFLIADEVGLGKTLVARGIIARTIDYLRDRVERIDIVYICSNANIARQNINRLNVTTEQEVALASRITLLPTQLSNLEKQPLNFVSFTPDTSFNLRSNLGTAEERVLLFRLIHGVWDIRGTGPLNVFQGNVQYPRRFRARVKAQKRDKRIDQTLAAEFARDLQRRVEIARTRSEPDLRTRYEDLCNRFRYARKHIPREDARDRREFVGELRMMLAATCLKALEPDLIILDEFQRFKYLLEGRDEAGLLAQELFDYSNEVSKARVLLLSATPYKMYTLNHEAADDDHYEDFIRTYRFLQSDAEQADQFEHLLGEYRQELFRMDSGVDSRLLDIKHEIETRLRRVMVRTERLAVTEDRSGMLVEAPSSRVQLQPRDVESFVALEGVARILDQDSTVEYWKSAPYLLNFMDNYLLKQAFSDAAQDRRTSAELCKVMAPDSSLLLPWKDILAYTEIDPGNARLRDLMAQTIGNRFWRLLWLPPSLPYYQLGGPFSDPALAESTKRLVFSSWRVVPRVVSTLLSYEAERRMIRTFDETARNTMADRRRRGPLLRFAQSEGRLTGMPVLGIIYPCVTLSRTLDPLAYVAGDIQTGGLLNIDQLLARFQRRIEHLLNRLPAPVEESGPEDEAWYWAAPILLDVLDDPQGTQAWFERSELANVWSGRTGSQESEDHIKNWPAHVQQTRDLIRNFTAGKLALGRRPADLASILARVAAAGPGVTALRVLSRLTGGSGSAPLVDVRDSAAQIAWSFISLFNLPEVMALLRGMNAEVPYWRQVLDYAVDGCLQSTLDEYAHILRESLGLLDKDPASLCNEIAEAMCGAITLRTANLDVDDVQVDHDSCEVRLTRRSMRSRFAVRFGDEKSEDGQEANRADQVRSAFNSPFWPFVLATTSVGQEGLDFHLYCHAVVHWNLPSNPVDLEQREGRVHRYKGHAVRKNIARRYGNVALTDGNPWELLFETAARDRRPGTSDLEPFWVYPGAAMIERHVPALPLSRDRQRLAALRQSLAVYRMVFGQYRQEDLVAYLVTRMDEAAIQRVVNELRVDLSPPRSE